MIYLREKEVHSHGLSGIWDLSDLIVAYRGI